MNVRTDRACLCMSDQRPPTDRCQARSDRFQRDCPRADRAAFELAHVHAAETGASGPEDLIQVLMANAGVVAGMREAEPRASPRLVGFILDSYRAERAQHLPQPPTPAQVQRAMRQIAVSHSGRDLATQMFRPRPDREEMCHTSWLLKD
jgi:hypothetical protein